MLHSDTIEILLPEKISQKDELPTILSIGPSFTMIVPIVLMALLSTKIYGSNGSNYMLMALATGGSSALMGLVWGVSNHIVRHRKYLSKIKKSKSDFHKYINNLKDELMGLSTENADYMYERYPSASRMLDKEDSTRFFQDDDYLFLRLGIGQCLFQVKLVKQDKKEMFPDESVRIADDLIEEFKYLDRVPVGIDFEDVSRLGIEGQLEYSGTYEYILEMILKIAYSYESNKVKICFLYDKRNENHKRLYETIKFLPHVFAKGNTMRLCAGDEDDGSRLLSDVDELIENSQYIFFIIVLNANLLKGEVLSRIIYEDERKNIKIMWLTGDMRSLAVSFRDILKLPEEGLKNAYLYMGGNRKEYSKVIIPDRFSNVLNHRGITGLGMKLRETISCLEIKDINEDYIPPNVNFLELFDAKSVEEIDIDSFYKNNRSSKRLKAPIGMGTGREKIYLDVHEKFHGPHGLIAGTTGSGKSELLQTYLISLCISYSPREINFFLIDYKGGGTGNFISELPHCAGIISNLSGNDIQRAMEAIKAENRRRQQLFSDCGVNHIDSYAALLEEGLVSAPLPHLILIIDEFAELKKEEPEFMQQIISLSAVGRSLGIHLILATQKPQGVVDEKIWSNSKFRLCLKVQDKQDSMDMLHRKDAAYLHNPGECYFQIGNDEYLRCFKAGYCGDVYSEISSIAKTSMILETGQRVRLSQKNEVKGAKLLECLVNYVNRYCEDNSVAKAKLLWMDELPERIELCRPNSNSEGRLCKLDEGTNELVKEPVIELGMYDDPAFVRQDRFYYSPKTDGHLAIAGSLSTGKTNVIKCIISQITDYPFLLVSMQESELNYALECANCLGVLDCVEGVPIFLYHLLKLSHKQDIPHFVLIDNFALFYKALSEDEAQKILQVIQEGISNNIFFVMTGSMLGDFPTKIYSKIRTTLCLEMNDKYQYCDIMRNYRINVLPSGGIPGRCLYEVDGRILKCQVYDASKAFESVIKNKDNAYLCTKLPMYLDCVTPYEMADAYLKESSRNYEVLPIGYSLKTGYIRGIKILGGGSFLISGYPGSGRHSLMENMKTVLEQYPANVRERVIFIEELTDTDSLKMFSNEILSDKYIVALINPQSMSEMIVNPLFKSMMTYAEGIHLGPNAASQRVLSFDDLSYGELSMKMQHDVGLLRLHGRTNTIRIKLPGRKQEGNYDDYD